MNALLEERKEELISLCRRHKVARLELFGSAATGAFEPGRSDLDFLVSFDTGSAEEHADCYFGLLADLEDLFGRSIDLVEVNAIDNPYFLKVINSSKALVYEG